MEDLLLDYKYIAFLGDSLEGFKSAGNNNWNFRCPICGDSEKNHNKRRGYIFLRDGKYIFHCFNCGASKLFKNFLKEVNNDLYKEYQKEKLLTAVNEDRQHKLNLLKQLVKQSHEIPKCNNFNTHLIPISALSTHHPAYLYLLSRQLPETAFKNVYWTDTFDKLINETFGDKYAKRFLPSSGIVFPIRAINSRDYPVIGYQLRSIDPNVAKAHRFVNCSQDGFNPVFGIERIDKNKQIYVVEGPIDSLFLPNCIAVMTASLWKVNIKNAIYINDCEPRNEQVVNQIKRCIDNGLQTTLLPHKYESCDINDLVKNFSFTESELVQLINSYTYKGISAKLNFTKWKLTC